MADVQPPEASFQAFADARRRPALFFFVDHDPIYRRNVLELHDALGDRQFEELDLVIHSGGGSAHAAYQTMMLLRLHAKKINACVPFWAKSAATLLCLGADQIVLGEHAELGPLDVQIYEEKKAGQGEYHSALDPFKALEQMQTFSVEALSSAMRVIVSKYSMSYDESLHHAVAFVNVTTGPLVGRLDPEKIGQYSRELSVATEYAIRLLRRGSGWPRDKINQVVDQLVYGYPSHEFIIDFQELVELGFDVELFAPGHRSVVSGLRASVEGGRTGNIIQLVEPSNVSATDGEEQDTSESNGVAPNEDLVTVSSPTLEESNG